MKKISLALIMLIIVGICIPAVSAETIIDEDIFYNKDTSTSTTHNPVTSGLTKSFKQLSVYNIQNRQNVGYMGFVISGDAKPSELVEGRNTMSYTLDGVSNPCYVYVNYNRNFLGSITSTQILIFYENWDVNGGTGTKEITFSQTVITTYYATSGYATPNVHWHLTGNYEFRPTSISSITVPSYIEMENHLTISKNIQTYIIDLYRSEYASRFEANLDDTIVFYNEDTKDLHTAFAINQIDNIKIIVVDKQFMYPLGTSAGTPDETSVTVYVRNSQTNALLANAHINISASVNGNLHAVVNETVPSGIYSSEMQPTGGGMPNPDFYRLITTAEGYNSIMPYIDFEVDGGATIYAYLDPIGGAPEDENKTFIDFYVRDLAANGISGATVNFGGYTLITNSAGYTIFEVDKSKTYSWTVSKSGYGSLTGNAVIGGNARHTINTVIAPAVTPTTPTPIPTSTHISPTSTPISPTPTMTAPNGEPVSNWLEWFAAHFGMILGGGAEIGKIFMWLCFAVPVGVYVGKEAKAGAAGFMVGAGIVTLFFVLIGWVPIWLLVLLALIIGLLYAKVFNNSDNGGGR